MTRGPTIIVGRKGTAGAIYYAETPCYPIDTVYCSEPKHISGRFFARLLAYLELGKLDQSTTIPSLARQNFDPILVPFPGAPHQERISDKIDELFSDIEEGERALERARKLLDRYRQAVLKAAVSGELTKDWREKHKGEIESGDALLTRILKARREAWEQAELAKMRGKGKEPEDDRWKMKYEEPEPPSTAELPPLPEGWVWATVEQLSFVTGGLTKNPDRLKLVRRVPYLRVANVYADRLQLEDIDQIGISDAETDRVMLVQGDLLVVEGNGSADQIGRVAVWDGSIPNCAHQNHIIKVRFVIRKLAQWTMRWLLSRPGRTMIENVASSTSGLYTLSLSKVSTLAVPLPPIDEIAHALELVDEAMSNSLRTVTQVEEQVRHAEALRQSILTAAFSGNLVPQDPSDEPASVLLDRIRAERAAGDGPRKRGRVSRRPRSGRSAVAAAETSA